METILHMDLEKYTETIHLLLMEMNVVMENLLVH